MRREGGASSSAPVCTYQETAEVCDGSMRLVRLEDVTLIFMPRIFCLQRSEQARGTAYDEMMHAVDWTPTLANITGIPTVRAGETAPRYHSINGDFVLLQVCFLRSLA